MERSIEQMLITHQKADTISFLKAHPDHFEEAITLAISDRQPHSWRAASLLWSCMEKNDPRLQGQIKNIISRLPDSHDGHRRELLKILLLLEPDEEDEGILFDFCVELWKETRKQPSVRYIAFQTIIRIAQKYPDLLNEIAFLTQSPYLDSLSPGIKHTVEKVKMKLPA